MGLQRRCGEGWGGAQSQELGQLVSRVLCAWGPMGGAFTFVQREASGIPDLELAKRLLEFFKLPLPALKNSSVSTFIHSTQRSLWRVRHLFETDSYYFYFIF